MLTICLSSSLQSVQELSWHKNLYSIRFQRNENVISKVYLPTKFQNNSFTYTRRNSKNVRTFYAQSNSAQVVSTEEGNASDSIYTDLDCVLVAGATGGVGQLVVARLLDRGIKTRALVRDQKKAKAFFGEHEKIEYLTGDTRNVQDLNPSVFEGITHVICCTGTTAFPSRRWDGDNTPEKTDWDGIRNIVSSLPSSIKRFVLVSSVGVTRFDQLPWSIMNLFGVLKFKKMSEDFLHKSGIPFTIIRPGRLMDGPFTSYDLNTLLKATAGSRRAIVVAKGDKLAGETSRHDVAEACIQALTLDCTIGQTYEINSVDGSGPGVDNQKWKKLFEGANQSAWMQ